VDEDVAPEPRLEMAFELGQVELRPCALVQKALPVAAEVEAEVEQARRNGRAV